MRILHTADLHIGFTAYSRTDPTTGTNVRMTDIFKSFDDICNIAVREKVDAVLIAGDLFNSVRVSNQSMLNVMTNLNMLTQNHITTFIIGGNHDTPKTKSASSPLELLGVEELFDIVLAYDKMKQVKIGDTTIHLVPYSFDKAEFLENIDNCKQTLGNGVNILSMHVATETFKMLEYDEILFTKKEIRELKKKFDYIALGHYHGLWIDNDSKMAYAGCPQRLTFNEADQRKGCIILDIRKGKVVASPVYMECRDMLDLPGLDLGTSDDPTRDILNNIPADITDKICRMKIANVPALLYKAIDFRQLREATDEALNFELIFDIFEESVDIAVEKTKFASMEDEWTRYIDSIEVSDRVSQTGLEYILNAKGDV